MVSMSKKEFDRLEVLLGVQSGRLRVADACELLRLKRRQVFRLLRGLKQDGATSLLSKRRGRPSNHRLPGSRSIGGSLQPAIPRRVAPQQSPLPLHQSPTILAQSTSCEAIK